MNEVYIINTKRTPIGVFLGSMSDLDAITLGVVSVEALFQVSPEIKEHIDSIFMGNVLSANLGQNPARQIAIHAGLPKSTIATTVNKVCASGMKAIMLGAQQIQLGIDDLVIAGGVESMSNVPFYASYRKGSKFGNADLIDGLLKDGLTDVYKGYHMGNAAETTIKKYAISREEQDAYAIESYEKAQQATENGKFVNEIVPVTVTQNKETKNLTLDEDIFKLKKEKVQSLKPSFESTGKITAANASNLSDGSSALLLASKKTVEKYNLHPIAKIIGYADAAQDPEDFSTSPSLAIKKLFKQTTVKKDEIDFFEINGAYASVVLANTTLLDLDIGKVNVYGGAIALGHPLGASGARIVTTLLSVLTQEKGKHGIAAICNGGGGASAILVEKI